MSMMLPAKTSLVFIFILEFKACVLTTVLSTADRVVNGQDLKLICTHSTAIADTSAVYVLWIENGNTRGDLDKFCDDTFGPVDTAQYNFSCLSIRNYTWTIKNVQESRNNSEWTCSIRIDTQPYVPSDPTTIYVISPITSLSIDGTTNVSAEAGSQTTFSCTTSTGRPVSRIRWYFDAGTPSNTSDDIDVSPTTSEPVFDFGNETTSGSVTITAESSRNGWRIYATANNTESMTPIKSSNEVTLTVKEMQSTTVSSTIISSTSDSTPDRPCWCLRYLCWCIVIIVIVLILIAGCIAVYCWCKGKCCFKKCPYKGKQDDGESNKSISHVKMEVMSEKSNATHKELSGNNSGSLDGTGDRKPITVITTNKTSLETKALQLTGHDVNQVDHQWMKTKETNRLPPITGHSKVETGVVQDFGELGDKNTPRQKSQVNNEVRNDIRPQPKLPKIESR